MGQYMKGRLSSRLEWLGDMEPEYEEMMEWMCLVDEVSRSRKRDLLPLSWVVMANAQRSNAGPYNNAR